MKVLLRHSAQVLWMLDAAISRMQKGGWIAEGCTRNNALASGPGITNQHADLLTRCRPSVECRSNAAV